VPLARRTAGPGLHPWNDQPERQAAEHQTNDCVPNWTDTVRPPTSYTNKLKVLRIDDYGFKDKILGHYEEDHLIPLAVGGSPRSPKNLWPEPYKGKWGARVKDKLERFLHDRVCDGTVRLSRARRAFRDWKAVFKRFDL
jgi:hypothetical protein